MIIESMKSWWRKVARAVLRGGAIAGPIAFLVLPKCPFCLLPLLAAAGLAVSPGHALDVLVVVFAATWGGAVWAMVRSPAALLAVVPAVAAAIAGRWLDRPVIAGAGVLAMLLVALALLVARMGTRARHACSRSHSAEPWNRHPTE